MTATLIIPTVHHRAAFFARTLQYFDACAMRGPVIVSDHSPAEHSGVIADIASRHTGLSIRLIRHTPDMHFLERLADCARAAETPYVHLHADDDFVLPETLAGLIREMDSDAGCVAAMGFNINAYFDRQQFTPIKKFPVMQADPLSRLIAQLENYSSVLYALRRRDEFVDSLDFSRMRCPDVQFWQYLESCVAVLKGKVLVMEDLHYVRETHAAKWSSTLVRERSSDHFPYLILNPEFQARVTAFRSAIEEACTSCGIEAAGDTVDNGIIHLLYRGFGAMGLPPRHTPEDTTSFKALLEKKLGNPHDPAIAGLNRIFAVRAAQIS
ncbi:MAG: TIGR00180 family glycosyltransferase [Betaproteobacteria bacterium]|jgi:glycosyltransferase domain-containing protein|nr:TIGR00180 family glycosyltransferase [Betaproteobacteria bacterium]